MVPQQLLVPRLLPGAGFLSHDWQSTSYVRWRRITDSLERAIGVLR